MSEVFCANDRNQSLQVWVSLRGNTKRAESKMVKFKLAEFKMAAIIKLRWEWRSLSQIELVWVRVLFKMAESKMAAFKMAAIIKLDQNEQVKYFECKTVKRLNPAWAEVFFWKMAGNQSRQVWVSLNEWKTKMAESKMVEFKYGRIQDGCHHQVRLRMNEFESDWIRLSQSFVQNGWIKDGRIQDGCHHQVESEWMSDFFFLCKWWGGKCE